MVLLSLGLGGGRRGAESSQVSQAELSQAKPSRACQVELGRVEPRVEPGMENLGGFVARTGLGCQ